MPYLPSASLSMATQKRLKLFSPFRVPNSADETINRFPTAEAGGHQIIASYVKYIHALSHFNASGKPFVVGFREKTHNHCERMCGCGNSGWSAYKQQKTIKSRFIWCKKKAKCCSFIKCELHSFSFCHCNFTTVSEFIIFMKNNLH